MRATGVAGQRPHDPPRAVSATSGAAGSIVPADDRRRDRRERTQPDYPLEALKQLVRNAIMHRNYESTNAPTRINWFSDRIEIINPGGPYGQSTIENFGRPGITDYRNPHIAEALHTLGFVQRFGVGIAIARKQLLDNGNPSLEFEVDRSHVLAIVRRGR
jgi:ATP-dependent DNA helicase RecG